MRDVVAPLNRRNSPGERSFCGGRRLACSRDDCLHSSCRSWRETRQGKMFSRLLVQRGVARRIERETITDFAARTDGDAKPDTLRLLVGRRAEFCDWERSHAEIAKLFRESNRGRHHGGVGWNLSMLHRDRPGRLWTGRAKIDNQWRRFLQLRFLVGIGRNVLQSRQGASSRLRRSKRGGSERGIFRFNPAQQRSAFLRVGGDQTDARRWRQKNQRGPVDDLKNVKAKRVQSQRGGDESKNRRLSGARRVPIKKQRRLGCL